jgi:hypothetical protein
MPYYINPPPQNPLARVFAGIIAILTIIGAFMIGMVALLVVGGLALIAGIAIWLRVMWIKRQLRKSGMGQGAGPNTDSDTAGSQSTNVNSQVIEAEYTVVSRKDDKK